MSLGGVPERDPASNRDGQFSCLDGLNHILQILRVLLGYESDRAYLRICGRIDGSARYRGEDPAIFYLSHKIFSGLSPNCVRDHIDLRKIREGGRIIERHYAISAKVVHG